MVGGPAPSLRDDAAVTALLDRLLHHAHVLKYGPRSWRTELGASLREPEPGRTTPTRPRLTARI